MKRKFFLIAIAVSVAGVATSVSAEWDQPMYIYKHYYNQVQVGESKDYCRYNGVINVWQWGIGSDDVVAIEWAICRDGQIVQE